MNCNGKCYLAKQLKKQQEEKERQSTNTKHEKSEVQSFFLPDQISFASLQLQQKKNYFITSDVISSSFLSSVFHPPIV